MAKTRRDPYPTRNRTIGVLGMVEWATSHEWLIARLATITTKTLLLLPVVRTKTMFVL